MNDKVEVFSKFKRKYDYNSEIVGFEIHYL